MNSFKKTILLSFLPLLILSGCKAQEPSVSDDSKPVASSGGNLLMLVDESHYGREVWEYMAETFKRKYPDIHILFEFTKSGAPNDISKYDLIFLNTKAETDAVKNQLCNISRWYDKNKKVVINDILKSDEYTFSVPLFLNTGGLWYGQKVFEDYGLAVPKNWGDVLELLEHFPQKKLAAVWDPEMFENSLLLPAVYSFKPFDSIYEVDKSDEYRTVFSRLEYLRKNKYIEEPGNREAIKRWLYGEYWFLCGELWQLDDLRENGAQLYQLNFSPGILQDSGNGQVLIIDSANIAVTKGCENYETAYAFLDFIFSNKSLNDIIEKTDVPVAVKLRAENEMSDVVKNIMRILSNPEIELIDLN